MIFLQFYIACQGDATQPRNTEKRRTSAVVTFEQQKLRSADKVLCVDSDGDGTDEILFVDGNTLYTPNTNYTLEGDLQTWFREDNKLWLGTGFSKDFRTAPMTIHTYENEVLNTFWTKSTTRNQITDLSVVQNRLYASMFSNGTQIHGGWLEQEFTPSYESNMAMIQRPIPENPEVLVVGRLYGDQPRSDGDLRIVNNTKSTLLKNFRGVRSLEIEDINGDGHSDLVVGDGWHYQYASMGQARLSLYLGPDFNDRRTVAILDNEYSINHIEIHRHGNLILAQGTSSVYVLEQTNLGWKKHKLTTMNESGGSTFCYDSEDSYVVVSGQPTQQISLSHLLSPTQ